MANIITSCRILFSIVLLFLPAFSPEFYVLYCMSGITDMIDGAVARKTGTVSEFGSKLDTLADIVFAAVCLIKILLSLTIPLWLLIWIGIIAGIKVSNIIAGFILQKKFVAEHTIINKITGAILFIFPLTLPLIDLKFSGSVICTIATFAALHEGHLIRRKRGKNGTDQSKSNSTGKRLV